MTDPIILYGSSVCPMVPPVRQTLQRARAPFEYINISFDSTSRHRVMEINNGNASVPTLVFPDGSTLTEPTDAELRRKLGALGYEVGPPALWERLLALLQSPILRMFAVVAVAVGALNRDPLLLAAGLMGLLLSYGVQFLESRR